MHFETSPTSSPQSAPISIGFLSPAESLVGSVSSRPSSSKGSSCAYPSWPTGTSLNAFQSSAPSAFISDVDLFPEALLDEDLASGPFLKEAPAPPRPVPMAQAFPLLPLYASEKPKKKRRNSRKQPRRSSKPMTPISESPEAPAE